MALPRHLPPGEGSRLTEVRTLTAVTAWRYEHRSRVYVRALIGRSRCERRWLPLTRGRAQKRAVDVLGEPLPLDPSAELDQLEGDKPASVGLAVSPNASKMLAWYHVLASKDAGQLIVVTVVDHKDEGRQASRVGPQHPERDLGRLHPPMRARRASPTEPSR